MSYSKQVKAFLRSHKGHTQKALVLVQAGIDHMFEHKDWTGLAMLIMQTEGRMGKQVRAIVAECCGGVTMRTDKKHDLGLRFELDDNAGPTEKMGVLRDLVADGETIFSDRVEQGLLGKEKVEPTTKTIEEVRNHVHKYLAKHGYTMSDLKSGPVTVAA